MKNCSKFFGSTIIGKKGQLVIPVETRKKMGWNESDQLLVFGLENGMVVLTKLDRVEEIAAHLEKKMSKIKKLLDKFV